MTKKLNVDRITNELEGSAFFPRRDEGRRSEADGEDGAPPEVPAQSKEQILSQPTDPVTANTQSEAASRQQSNRPARKHASTKASMRVTEQESERAGSQMIQQIRRTVRQPGKEVSYVRLTPQEKAQLADIVYTYKRQGAKTSENEINRIAVNYLLADYKENGAASVLVRVIEALRE